MAPASKLYAVPKSGFAAAPGRGVAPLRACFADKSKGSITAWAWDFGDTQSSNERNPVHVYPVAGAYTAKLTVTGPLGSNTKIKRVSVSKRR
jgi:PKD repeat protein